MRFAIEDPFWQLFPDAVIGIVVACGIDNTGGDRGEIAALLADAASSASAALQGADIAAHPAIAPWRQAYTTFGAKPSKFRSSIESLLRAAASGRTRPINPLVDLYNTVSLRHMLPCGGEDLQAIAGDIRLTRAAGGEHFVPLGAEAADAPQPGEVIYRDDAGVICRCWNWREADRTKLTAATTDAFLCVEALPAHGEAPLRTACGELAELVRAHLGGEARVEIARRERPMVHI
jgi:DNA/RNA-binding domain of Phe-tRNA-synthetase-like protein